MQFVFFSLRIPQRVYEELGEDPAADAYPSGNIPYPDGFEEGWIVVADELNYTNPLVSTVMDEARRFIANETDRAEDSIEKADPALVGDKSACFVHHRRHEGIGVVELVGNDDPTLLESIGIRNVP